MQNSSLLTKSSDTIQPKAGGDERIRFGLVSFFNGISTFVGYLMPKPFSKKNSSGTI